MSYREGDLVEVLSSDGYEGPITALRAPVLCYRTGVNGVPPSFARLVTLQQAPGAWVTTMVRDGEWEAV